MLYKMRSQLTGAMNTMDLPVTETQINQWRNGGQLIQRAFPTLTPSQREFLMTGATPEEWDAIIGSEEDDEFTEEDEQPF